MNLKLLDKKSLTIITSVQLYVWSFAWYISECFWVQLTNEAFGNEPRIISTYQDKGVDAFSIRFISIGSFLMKRLLGSLLFQSHLFIGMFWNGSWKFFIVDKFPKQQSWKEHDSQSCKQHEGARVSRKSRLVVNFERVT